MAAPQRQSEPLVRERTYQAELQKAQAAERRAALDRASERRGKASVTSGQRQYSDAGRAGELRRQTTKAAREKQYMAASQTGGTPGAAGRPAPLAVAPDAPLGRERQRQEESGASEEELKRVRYARQGNAATGGRLSVLRDRPLRREQQKLQKQTKKKKKNRQIVGAAIIRISWMLLPLTFGHSIYIIDLLFFIGFAVPLARRVIPEVGMEWFVGVPIKGKPLASKSTILMFKIAEFVAMFVITALVIGVDLIFSTILIIAAYALNEANKLVGNFATDIIKAILKLFS